MENLLNPYSWIIVIGGIIFFGLAVFLCLAAYNIDSDFSKFLGRLSVFNLLAGACIAVTLIIKSFNLF